MFSIQYHLARDNLFVPKIGSHMEYECESIKDVTSYDKWIEFCKKQSCRLGVIAVSCTIRGSDGCFFANSISIIFVGKFKNFTSRRRQFLKTHSGREMAK